MNVYFKRFVFTLTPLKRSYEFEDKFQLIPFVSEQGPKSTIAKHFPAFLEFIIDKESYDKITDPIDKLAFTENYLDEIINLLSSISNHRFFRYHSDYDSWRIEFPEVSFSDLTEEQKNHYNNQTSKWSSPIFMYPGYGVDQNITAFSKITTKRISIKPVYPYFTIDPVENSKKEIEFPETMLNTLVKYFNLDDNNKVKIRSVTKLINQGLEISTRMRSLSFLAYVSSIETLLSLEYDDAEIKFKCNSCKSIELSPFTCSDCGAPIWGISAKFYSFLQKYVSRTDKSLRKFKKIYGIRSQITHAGKLMVADLDMSLLNMDKKELDYLMLLETLQLARLSLTFWLLRN